MTLLVRDEADIVGANIAFHLHVGVDFVVAMDNGSEDGTREILESFEREGSLYLLHEPGNDMRQSEWVTRMARLAATEFAADWVINADADEFWWPRLGPLKEVLARIPQRFSTVRAFVRNFVPRAGEEDFFAERMTVRLVPGELSISSPFRMHPYQPQDKVIHRAHPRVTVSEGNHDAVWAESVDLRGWWPFEVLHFPIRSALQAEIKWRNWERHGYSGYDELLVGTPEEYYSSLEIDDDAFARGVSEGWLVVDTRLRDALRAVRSHCGSQGTSTQGETPHSATPCKRVAELELPRPTLAERAAFAADVAAGSALDSFLRARSRVAALEDRLGALERSPLHGLRCRVESARCWPRAPLRSA